MTNSGKSIANGFCSGRRFLFLFLIVYGTNPLVFADKIMLRGGGQIKGEILPDSSDPEKIFIFMERNKNPLRYEKSRVLEVTEEKTILDEYLPKRAEAPRTSEGQYQLGAWCERSKLKDLARFHYEEALRIDPDYGPAHAKVGHVQIGDRWLAGDDLKRAQGLVKVKGHWITASQKVELEKDEALSKEQSSWVRKLRILHDEVENGPEDRRRDAESKLMSIDDPLAVKPLIKVFNTESASSRKRLARILGAIAGPESAIGLVNGLVNEEVADVRFSFVDVLRRRDDPEIAKQLVKALKSNTPEYINRAAWCIANLNLKTITTELPLALTTSREETVLVPTTAGVGPAGASAGGFDGYSSAVAAYANASLRPQPIAWNGSSIAYLYPPSVAPGAVAYGAGSVTSFYGPMDNVVDPSAMVFGSNASGGSNVGLGAGPSRGPIPETVTVSINNPEVLAALIKFTGRDFGYDKDAWRAWIKESFKAEPPPLRRVPQP